jgi:hypothetical protein
MVRAPVISANISDPNTFFRVCPNSDSGSRNFFGNKLSLTRCLAECASNQSCRFAWQSTEFGNVTLSSRAPIYTSNNVLDNSFFVQFLQILALQQFWTYSPTAPCVTPDWDMVGATCLYVCEDTQNTQFSLFTNNLGQYDVVRGLVFPFEDGSMSCPLKPEMLINVCATPNNTLLLPELNLDEMGGNGIIPGMMANYSYSDRSNVKNGFTFQCPISKNCEYQSWTDARPWGLCSQETNANDLGTRSRFRTIIAQPQFLGDPCDVEEMVEYSRCNQSLTLNSSSDMWCPPYAGNSNVIQNVSEYACQKICKDMRAKYGPDACNSFMTFEEELGGRSPEVFLIEFPVGIASSSITQQQKLGLPRNFSVCTLVQLQQAWSSGMQSCKEGWFLNAPGNALQAFSFQQAGCSNVTDSLSIFVPSVNSPRVWIFGIKQDFLNLSVSGISVENFFSATSAPSFWDPAYFFTNQQFQSDLSCAFFTDRTDRLVGDCMSLSSMPTIKTSNLFDVPYSFSQNCSLTDWITVQDCSNTCALTWAQTRTVVNTFSSEGGLPCSKIPTFRSTLCSNFTCPQTFTDVCILNSLPTLSSFATSCSSADFAADVYLEQFSQSYLYNWAFQVSTTQNVPSLLTYFSSTVRKNALGGTLPVQLLDAINSQCGISDCISVSSGYFSLSAKTAPLGWAALPSGQTCSTNSLVQACLQQRLPSPFPGKMVYQSSGWTCPSTCRPGGLSFSCAMGTPPLETCSCTPSYLPNPPRQTQSLLYSEYTTDSSGTLLYSCLLPPQQFVFGCSQSSPCANIQCGIGNDGSPCNAASGKGTCDLARGSCTCISPPPTLTKNLCNFGCVNGANGLQCSGAGTCTYDATLDEFQCVCNAGRSGESCEQAGTGLVGLIETLLYEGTAVLLNASGNNELKTFSFYNPEPRCETLVGSYCAGSQLFAPQLTDQSFLFHGYYPPLQRISGPQNGYGTDTINPIDFSNICVNSLDASFNSEWVRANYLSTPLTSFTRGVLVPIACEDMVDGFGNAVYTITARFTSNTLLPEPLRNKLFYTRCPNPQAYGNSTALTYLFNPVSQFDAQGNAIFDLVDKTSSLSALCARV